MDIKKAVQRGKFVAIQYYLRKHEKSRVNNFMLKTNRERKTNTIHRQQNTLNHKDESKDK